jgi:type II secretory pathway pseudopilin PulG
MERMEPRIVNGKRRSGTGLRQEGFTYIGLLILIAIIGAGLASVGQVWHTTLKHEREKELLFVGDQFRQAINRYVKTNNRYPARLEDLLLDDHSVAVRRFLRKMYVDPMTGLAEWGVVKSDNVVVGVYSLSEDAPLKLTGFRLVDADFENKSKYSEWMFLGTARAAAAGRSPRAPVTKP